MINGRLENVEGISLSTFMCAHASCMHSQLVFMRTHTLFMCILSCSSAHTDACPSMRSHAGPYVHIHGTNMHMLALRNSFFVQFDYFSLFFPFFLSNHDSHAPFHLFLQVLPSFTGRGSTDRIPSWYRALMDDAKALVRVASFKPIIHLIP